jgi:hypothetical protein
MEEIFSFISNHYPVIGLMIIVAVIVYFATMYHVSIQNTHKKVNRLPCDFNMEKILSIDQKCDTNMEQISTIKNDVENVRDVVVEISKILKRKKKNKLSQMALQKLSPYRLTEIGQIFLEKTYGKACVDANADFFISELEKTLPLTAYDVEENAYSVLMRNTSKPAFNDIKNFVYISPEEMDFDGVKIEISLSSIIQAMSIYLRDLYLEKHPELLPNADMELSTGSK